MDVERQSGKFKGRGVGVRHGQTPISVKLPTDLDEIVRQIPNRGDFLREAIREKLIREGLLSEDNQ